MDKKIRFEAAAAHYRATGKQNFLQIAIRMADRIYRRSSICVNALTLRLIYSSTHSLIRNEHLRDQRLMVSS